MNKLFSLKSKLIIYTLFFIITSMVAMGFISDSYLYNYFHKDAKNKLHRAFNDLSYQLKLIEKDLLESVYIVSKNESVVASLNLINNYENIYDYNNALFDEEKKRIIEILLTEGNYSLNDHISVYDEEYRLVAFMDRDETESYVGFVSYENSKPVYYVKEIGATSFSKLSVLKHIKSKFSFNKHLDLHELQNDGILYKELEGNLHLHTHLAISRKVPENQYNILGYIEASNELSKKDISELIKENDLEFNYYFNYNKNKNKKIYIDKEEIEISTFDNSPLLFSEYSIDELILNSSSMNLFYSAVYTPLVEGALLITAQINKGEHSKALTENRQILIATILLIILVTVLVSLSVLNRMLSIPLNHLIKGIEVISKGEYTQKIEIKNKDELGVISRKFNEMANKISYREAQLDKIAHYDILTKIPNRAMFIERLEETISRAKRYDKQFAVFFLDLDEFKNINDTLGHDVGDELLIKISENILDVMRKNDLLARIGGDEFNILIQDLDSISVCQEIASKILKAMDKTITVNNNVLHVTSSIGISIYPQDGKDATTLLKNADLAMYHAKDSGRNQYHFFSEELEIKLKKRLAVLNELKNALSNNELKLFYQPKFSLETGDLVSAEALIRWENPTLGFIAPNDFIPLAEESGLIVQIGKWVIQQACQDFVEWKSLGFAISQVSINVSNVQFAKDDVVEILKENIQSSGIAPESIEIEITESYIHDNSNTAIDTLHKIRELGIDLAIDDFGTGYSSLSYLKQLPINRLKIDRSFISDIPHDNDDVEITKVIIALAKVMGLAITAEGIETMEQINFLKELKCDEGQGYIYSKALPYDQFIELIQKKPFFD